MKRRTLGNSRAATALVVAVGLAACLVGSALAAAPASSAGQPGAPTPATSGTGPAIAAVGKSTTRPARPAESPAATPQSVPTPRPSSDQTPPIPLPPPAAGRSAIDQRPVRTDPSRTQANPAETAQTAAADLPPAPAGLGFQRILGALAIVLGLIFALRWVLKRSINPASLPRESSAVQVLTRSPLSPRQQLLLVRVGRRLLVVADSGGQLNSLSEITDPDEVAALVGQLRDERLTSASRSFGNLLGMWRGANDEAAGDEALDDGNSNAGTETDTDAETYPRSAPDVPRRRAVTAGADETDDPSVDSARSEIHGLMERVRSISHQFKR